MRIEGMSQGVKSGHLVKIYQQLILNVLKSDWIFDISPSSNNKSRYNVGHEAADAAYNVFRIRVMG